MTDAVAAAREALDMAVSTYASVVADDATDARRLQRWNEYAAARDAYATAQAAAARAEVERLRDVLDEADTF